MGKRGPKRQSGRRTASGRLAQGDTAIAERRQAAFDKAERKTLSVAVEARQRIFGVSETNARDQRAGTVIGRMRLRWHPDQTRDTGTLSEPQYQAAMQYIRDLRDYRIAIDAPHDAKAATYDGIQGGGQPVTPQWASNAIKRHKEARDAVQACQNGLGGRAVLFAALERFLLADKHIYNLEGDLRLALNALANFYGLERVK